MAIYMWREIAPAGIYWSSSLGLITIGDGNGIGVTIADKNLGATVVYNDSDVLSEDNCGKFYQRGNNYGFSFTGATTTSSTQVDTTNYGPGNYYNSSTFILRSTPPYDWSSVQNDNLRGNTTNTTEARRGPCAEGYHIPNEYEIDTLITLRTSLGISVVNYANYLKIAPSGQINQSGTVYHVVAMLWTTSPYDNVKCYALRCYRQNDQFIKDYYVKSYGLPIRPFKNSVVIPDGTWTKLN